MTADEIRAFSTELRKRAQSPITGQQLAMEITLANVQAQLEIAAQLANLNETLKAATGSDGNFLSGIYESLSRLANK